MRISSDNSVSPILVRCRFMAPDNMGAWDGGAETHQVVPCDLPDWSARCLHVSATRVAEATRPALRSCPQPASLCLYSACSRIATSPNSIQASTTSHDNKSWQSMSRRGTAVKVPVGEYFLESLIQARVLLQHDLSRHTQCPPNLS